MRNTTAFLFCLFSLAATSQQDSAYYAPDYLEVEEICRDLKIPWDMVMDVNGNIWFTERDGGINRIDPATGIITEVHWVEETFQSPENSGMHSIALHPRFPKVPYVFVHFTFHKYLSRIERYEWDAKKDELTNRTEILELSANSSHNGSRILFEDDSTFFFSIGDAYTSLAFPQDLGSNNGKILRINIDGSVPSDNPIPGSLVWSYGHRNPQGLCFGKSGQLYSSEHGADTDDELNLILPGKNYGWPGVAGFCDTEEEKAFCDSAKSSPPMIVWTPTEGVAGLDFYDHQAIPEWKNCLLLGVLKEERLKVLPLSNDGSQIDLECNVFWKDFGRIRDVMAAPDGSVYLCTTNMELTGWGKVKENDDKILRIYNPAVHQPMNQGRTLDIDLRVHQVRPGDLLSIKCYGEAAQIDLYLDGSLIASESTNSLSVDPALVGHGLLYVIARRGDEAVVEKVCLH